MDINNVLRGVGVAPSKVVAQSDNTATRKTDDGKEVTSSATGNSEKVTITDTTARLRQAVQVSANEPEVNETRVAQLKASLADGSYKIRPDIIAARLLAFEAALKR